MSQKIHEDSIFADKIYILQFFSEVSKNYKYAKIEENWVSFRIIKRAKILLLPFCKAVYVKAQHMVMKPV